MPALDDAAHIEAAIGSFLSQEYDGDLVLAIGLGPSTDGTNDLRIEQKLINVSGTELNTRFVQFGPIDMPAEPSVIVIERAR